MTTIAACVRTGIMASDSQWTDCTTVGSIRKVWRVRGDLVGFAGDVEAITETLAWFRGGFKGQAPADEVVGLILRRNGLFRWTPLDGELREESPFFAIGTGGMAARSVLTAMVECGHPPDCAKAIRIVSTVDPWTGGRVRVYKLGN